MSALSILGGICLIGTDAALIPLKWGSSGRPMQEAVTDTVLPSFSDTTVMPAIQRSVVSKQYCADDPEEAAAGGAVTVVDVTLQTCVICLQGFEVAQGISRLQCSHAFHSPCLDAWVKARGSRPWCPLRCDAHFLSPRLPSWSTVAV
eukprot:CAMPEP_0178404714 /NCGR_PEP_ID=MMETSP0689_2-20121128/18029_1 /TAXON_ID=160604 /ORGANISM="Amphidinium massartii, Strain CS-259" /LENGTH=146 /DNA_ID=CAMNT_0020025713 /DNA_START=348 /DNA_END=788 /DNA_ORIENTATION=+